MSDAINDDELHLDSLLASYIKEKVLRPASQRAYQCAVRNAIRQGIYRINQNDIKNRLIDWRDCLLKNGSAATWNNYLRHLRTIGNWCFKERIYIKNPFVHVSFAPEEKRYKEVLTLSEIRKLLLLINQSEKFLPQWFWSIVFKTLYYTGIRRTQLVGITINDIDFQNRVIRLDAKYSKTKDERFIPIHDNLLSQLEYLEKQIRQFSVKENEQLFNITLFNQKYKGDRMTAEQVSGFFRRLKDYSGIKVSAHMLRHTMATEWVNNKGNIKSLQEALGHTDIRTTMSFYVHPDIAEMKKNIDRIPKI